MTPPSRTGFFAFHGPMAPGVRMMRSLSLPAKAALVVAAFLLPIVVLGWFYWSNAGGQIEFAAQERRGAEWLQAWTPALRAAQEHRALALRAHSGDAQAQARLPAAGDAWQQALAGLADTDRRWSVELATGQRVAELQSNAQSVRTGWRALAPDDARRAHDDAVGALLAAAAAVGDSSNLVLDPDLDSFYLMQTSVIEGPNLIEALARLRQAGADLAAGGDDARQAAAARALAAQASVVALGIERQRVGLGRATQYNAALAAPLGAEAKLARVASLLDGPVEKLQASGARIAAADWWAQASAALEASTALNEAAMAQLVVLLDARIDRLQRDRLAKLAFATASVLVALYLLAAMYRVLQGGLGVLSDHIVRLAQGDFSARPYPWGQDEVANALHKLRESLVSMSATMREVYERAEQVSGSAREIATGNGDLSSRTEHSAASLETVTGHMDALSKQVAENVDALESADTALGELVKAVRESEGTVGGLVDRMTSLHAQSRRINEIVGLIDGIAFQTSILALNASVEAARAGEMGRGFAVVAQEVRSLAQRSAEAARQIKGIVDTSTADIEAGSRLAQQAGRRVADTVGTAGEVAGLMGRVLSGSRDQRDRVTGVHGMVVDLSSVTQSNAAMVEEVAAATQSLDASGRELHALVSRFKLGAGTADPPRRA